MDYTIVLEETAEVAPGVHRLRFTRPDGYGFTPGQATEMALDRDGWREAERPFTFTGLPDEPGLQFTIKSYPDHDGVTARIPDLRPGDKVLIGDAWGAIADRGPGVFVAGGAGVTPFIPILRDRARKGDLDGCTLVLADKDWDALILRDDWLRMEGLKTLFVLEDEVREGCAHGQVDQAVLESAGLGAGGRIYVCGPPPMEEAVTKAAETLGAADIIHEE